MSPRSSRTRVLMTNQPRAYRESIAEAIRALRPEVDVLTAPPESLAEQVASYRPDAVVCDEATEEVRGVAVWVELYPHYGSRSVVSLAGRRTEIEDIQLSDLLSVVDQAHRIAQLG